MLNIGFGEQGVEEHLRMLAAFRHWLLAHPWDYVLIDTAGDIKRRRATGRLAVACDWPTPACRRRTLSAIALRWTSP